MIRARLDRLFERFCRKGDPRALARVFDVAAPELWRVASHLCRNTHEAEDAVQSTFLCAIEDREGWDRSRPLMPWLLGILVNRIREARRRTARAIDVTRIAPREEPDASHAALVGELGDALRSALAGLPSPYRQTLEQHLLLEHSASEIASKEQLAAGTVRMRIHRGLEMLRRRLPKSLSTACVIPARLTDATAAAMRERLLVMVPGGKAMLASSTGLSAALAFAMTTTHKLSAALLAAAVLTLAIWAGWPDPPMNGEAVVGSEPGTSRAVALPVATATRSTGQDPAPRRETVAVTDPAPVPGGTRVRVLVRNAETKAGIAGVWLEATSTRVVLGIVVTDRDGFAEFDCEPGPVEFSLPRHGRTAGGEPTRHRVEARAGQLTDHVVELPTRLRTKITVRDEAGRALAGAQVLGRSWDDGNTDWNELGRTDLDGTWQGTHTCAGLSVLALADGQVASRVANVDAKGDAPIDIELRVGPAATRLRGIVVDRLGAPIARARLAIRFGGDAAHLDTPLVFDAGPDGRFECNALPEGEHDVVAWSRETTPLTFSSRAYARLAVATSLSHPVEIELRVGEPPVVAGAIRNADGTPVAGAFVTAMHLDTDLHHGLLAELTRSAITAADGTFRIEATLPGSHGLAAQIGDRRLEATLELRSGETVAWHPQPLVESQLAITLLDREGKALSGWRIEAIDPAGHRRARTTSSSGGVIFESVGDEALEFLVFGPDAPFASLRHTGLRMPSDPLTWHVDPHAMPSGRVTGTFVDPAGGSLEGLEVELRGERSPGSAMRAVDPMRGRFAIDALVPGTYRLLARRGGSYVFAADPPIEVPAEGTVDLGVLTLARPGTLRFVITPGSGLAETPIVRVAQTRDGHFLDPGRRHLSADGLGLVDVPPERFFALLWGEAIEP
ncbi:MAG: sigma-70 family RNA polymerase sigma factor, partial [Planctomycetes bacterium]|nr:sigma-70 family RNA polymerase sigma factor [Planctomycetota bacterium]